MAEAAALFIPRNRCESSVGQLASAQPFPLLCTQYISYRICVVISAYEVNLHIAF